MDRKIWYIVLVIGLAFILAGLISYKIFSSANKELPSIEEEVIVIEEQNNASENKVNDASAETSEQILKTTDKKIVPPKPHAKAPEINPKYVKEQVAEEVSTQRKFTPEEEEALKKIPTSKVVVVDEEIKIKSSGKYHFR